MAEAPHSNRNKTILVIEDAVDILASVKEILELEGYQVLTAETTDTALQLLKNGPQLHLILLDLMLPGIPVLALMEEKRKLPPPANEIPTLAFSADSAIEKKSISLGVNGFIRKPIDLDSFTKIIQDFFSATTKMSLRSLEV